MLTDPIMNYQNCVFNKSTNELNIMKEEMQRDFQEEMNSRIQNEWNKIDAEISKID